jgi:hypothetical protein
MADKKIIKARELESSGARVENVNLGIRKFHDKVFKEMSPDEKPVALEAETPAPDFDDLGGPDAADGGGEHQVRIERVYSDAGDLAGLTITCRCGEVIELEFTREDDMGLPGVEPADSEPLLGGQDAGDEDNFVDNE